MRTAGDVARDAAPRELFGPYVVLERLGVGGMATVHRVIERGLEGVERVVALKRLHPHVAAEASFVRAFVREGEWWSCRSRPPSVPAGQRDGSRPSLLPQFSSPRRGLSVYDRAMSRKLASSLLVVLAACSDGGDPPEISNLTMTPQTVPVGAATTVSGTMNFSDADGDVDKIAAAVIVPGGARTELDPVPVQTVGDPTAGMVNYAFLIAPPSPGSYTVELWLIDDSGNESNLLSGQLLAQ